MPQKLHGISYPKTVAELLRDRDLLRLFLETYPSPEVRNRIRFLKSPPTPDTVYSEYIAKTSRTPIRLPRLITKNATDMVKEDEYDPGLWQSICDLVEANCRNHLEDEVFKEFFSEDSCANFKQYHLRKLLQAGEKKYGSTNDIMVRLNLTDAPTVRGLLAEMIRGDRKGIYDLAKYAIRKAKLKAEPIDVIDAIKTGKGLTNAGAFKVDVKKLKLCGFDKTDAKVRNRVEDMVNAWMSGDKTTAKAIFKLLQKDAAKDSILAKATIESLFKSFKNFKVIIG